MASTTGHDVTEPDDKEFHEATKKQAPSGIQSTMTHAADQFGRVAAIAGWVDKRPTKRFFIILFLVSCVIAILVARAWAEFYFSFDSQVLTSAESAPIVDAFSQQYEISISEETQQFLRELLSK